jgi:pilus assembly protein CpaB
MQSGDYILSGKVSDMPLTEFAYLHELDGSRLAMSITIKSFAGGLSGKLESGDIIGVIATDVGNFRETVVPPELRYVRVIAVTDGKGYDKEYTDSSDDEKQLPSTVTLLVLPEQAQILAELESAGRIHLTLIYRGLQENADKFIQIQDDYINSLQDEADETETDDFDNIDEVDGINNINTADDRDKRNESVENPASSAKTATNEPQEEESGGTKIIMPDGREVIIGG